MNADVALDEDLPRNAGLNSITAEEEEDFARELAKMVAETGGTQASTGGGPEAGRKLDRNPTSSSLFSDQGLPVLKNILKSGVGLAASDHAEAGDQMKFTLLTKKGNKQQVRSILSGFHAF